MHKNFLTRSALLVLLLGGVTACGDSRLGDLSEGIDRDSVAVVMGTATPDHQQNYLNRGVFWEILYYAAPGGVVDTAALREMSPVVLTDGKVAGWGWGFLEDAAADNGFEVQPAK
jgi:hypothetical protein